MNQSTPSGLEKKTVLVTGGARRIGASIVRECHRAGARVLVHYRNSRDQARQLARELNADRADSAVAIHADLQDPLAPAGLAAKVREHGGRLDVLVNNAADFFATPFGSIGEDDWDRLIDSNLRAPFFLSQAVLPLLQESGGLILNILDIHADKPLAGYSVYCVAKAGLSMLTRSLALELAPEVRVNGIAPGAILWPARGFSAEQKDAVLALTPMGRTGDAGDIASLAVFLATRAGYITGQVIAVDGGRSLTTP
ncbi:MAG: pteridine reductase [Gammaproteobacteria bacterium]